jgi:predicted transcriptional regulator
VFIGVHSWLNLGCGCAALGNPRSNSLGRLCARLPSSLRQRRDSKVAALANPPEAAIVDLQMSGNVQEIEQAIRTLPRPEVEQLRNWIEDYLEDQLELSEEFKAKIEQGKRDIAEGHVRTHQPDEA